MTDDLLDRMTETATWAATAPVDPAADLARGRRRLRRRRTGQAALAGGAIAAVAVLGGQLTVMSPDRSLPDVGPAATAGRTPTTTDRLDALRDVLLRHVDPHRLHAPWPAAGGGGNAGAVNYEAGWRQGSGVGFTKVYVIADGGHDQTLAGGFRFRPDRCDFPWDPVVDDPPYRCRWQTVDGKRVLIGTVDSGPKSYFASYLRPDGTLVVAVVDGDFRGAFVKSSRPGTNEEIRYPRVPDPDVTIGDLVAAVTDPAMTQPR